VNRSFLFFMYVLPSWPLLKSLASGNIQNTHHRLPHRCWNVWKIKGYLIILLAIIETLVKMVRTQKISMC
jgi:hypothetical protein